MTTDSFQAIVDLQVHEFAGAKYPVVMVTLPASKASSLEILVFDHEHMCILPKEDVLDLHVGDEHVAYLDDRNGNLAEFKQLLEDGHMFALTLTSAGEVNDDTLYILTRTLMAENITGRVVSNTGPQKMTYEEALKGSEDSPEDHCTGRSFKTAVEIAIAMRDEDSKPTHLTSV